MSSIGTKGSFTQFCGTKGGTTGVRLWAERVGKGKGCTSAQASGGRGMPMSCCCEDALGGVKRPRCTSECVMSPWRHTRWTCTRVTSEVWFACVVARRASMGCHVAPWVRLATKGWTGSGGGGGAGDGFARGAGGMATAGKSTRARTSGKAKLGMRQHGRRLQAGGSTLEGSTRSLCCMVGVWVDRQMHLQTG
eukprot:6488792-Amphidinium_carterae.3